MQEHLPGHWKTDVDVMLRGGLFSVSWNEAFVKARTVINKFNVYISTYPGGMSFTYVFFLNILHLYACVLYI